MFRKKFNLFFLSMIDLSPIIHKKVCNHTFLYHSPIQFYCRNLCRKQRHRLIDKLEPLYKRNINISFKTHIQCIYNLLYVYN